MSWIGTNLLPGPQHRVTHGPLEKLVIGLFQGEGDVEDVLGDPAGYHKDADGPERKKEGLRRVQLLAELLKAGGGDVEVAEDIQPKRYAKCLWNASFGLVCAMSRATVSEIVSPAATPFTIPIVRRLMQEIIYVGRSWGYGEDVLPMKEVDNVIKMTVKVSTIDHLSVV